MGRLFGTDGIRGIANSFLTCELALKVGRAAGSVLSDGSRRRLLFCVGCDTRISSDMLSFSIASGPLLRRRRRYYPRRGTDSCGCVSRGEI